jgi:hypothetical protein
MIFIDEYLVHGKWTRKKREEYTDLLLSNERNLKPYKGDELDDSYFVYLLLNKMQENGLTSKFIAKKLGFARFTFYSVKNNQRKLKSREKYLLFNIALEIEFNEICFRVYSEKLKALDKELKFVVERLKITSKQLEYSQKAIESYKHFGTDASFLIKENMKLVQQYNDLISTESKLNDKIVELNKKLNSKN